MQRPLVDQPDWMQFVQPGDGTESYPEVRDARAAMSRRDCKHAMEQLLKLKALQAASMAAAAPDDQSRLRFNSHYECIQQLMATLFVEPQPPRANKEYL